MRKGRIKRILRLCHFEFFEKGEGRHKRIKAVSPSFCWKREKRDTKRIQTVSPWRILFGKGRRDEKNEQHKFSRFGKPENFRKLLAKEEEEGVQRDSKIKVEKLLSKELLNECIKCKSKPCFYRLFKSSQETIRRVITFRRT